ncbi:MAG: glycosyltransferase family 4 protein [Bacteroidales bacterium]|nr:glycosyltransferase family 4 protein [Bacteroidales bacterium]
MKTILMTAYDINPYKGSEAATGWNFVLQTARFNKVVAVTRKNNREPIEQYIKEYAIDDSNIKFYYYDLPYYLRFWKRGARGSSLYFYLWQMFMPLFVKTNKIKFDIAHNVNFHADAFPTFLWLLGKPTVWGPINHHEKIPKQYIFSKKEYIKDRVKWIIKLFFWNLDPFLWLSKMNADKILGGNRSVQKRLRVSSDKFRILSQVASHNIASSAQVKEDVFNIVIAARFVPLKGVDISLLAFDRFYNNLSEDQRKNVKLSILGKGPLEKNLKEIQQKLNSSDSIEFINWIDKEKMGLFYGQAKVFLFPSYEGAGMVVAEAMSHGLPVVCFDNYGPGEIIGDHAGIKIPYSTYDNSVIEFAKALRNLYENKDLYNSLSKGAREHFENKYTWDAKGITLEKIYKEVLETKEKI